MVMELPWLKNKSNEGGGGPTVERQADSTHPDKLLSHVASELMDALEKRDHQGILQALRAFVSMANDEDEQ